MCRRLACLLVAIAPVLLATCGDPVEPPNTVRLEGLVLDGAGSPVQDARIGILYKFPVNPVATLDQGLLDRLEIEPPPLVVLPLRVFPNPFERTVSLRFGVAKDLPVELAILARDRRRLRTLLHRELPAGIHMVIWDSRDDNGRQLPPGSYIAQVAIGPVGSAAFSEIPIFLWTPDAQFFQQGYVTTSGPDGRFTLDMKSLPIGDRVAFVSVDGESLGTQAVSSTVGVVALTTQTSATQLVELGDLKHNVSVTLKLQ